MIFQSYALWPHMTVFDNVAYPLKALGIVRNQRSDPGSGHLWMWPGSAASAGNIPADQRRTTAAGGACARTRSRIHPSCSSTNPCRTSILRCAPASASS